MHSQERDPEIELAGARTPVDPVAPDAELQDAFRLLEAGTPQSRESIQDLRTQLQAGLVRVVVLGEAKRGKSSLVNALLGREVLPTGVVPVTSVSTEVRRAPADTAWVSYLDGRLHEVSLDRVAEYVSEQHNPANERGVDTVHVGADVRWPDSVLLIDTPGSGSVVQAHDLLSRSATERMDVALVVVSADAPVSARERRQILDAARQSEELAVVVSKCDLLSAAELGEVLRYTREVARGALGSDVRLVPVSAKRAGAGHPGLEVLHQLIEVLLTDPSRRTLERSIRRRALRVAYAGLDDVTVQTSLADTDARETGERVDLFTTAVDEARRRRRECKDVVVGGVRSINEELDISYDAAVADAVRTVRQLVARLASEANGSQAEAGALRALTERATQAAERWRTDSATQAERELDQVGRRATAWMRDAFSELRAAASRLLRVDLHILSEPIQLPAHEGFFYVEHELVDAAAGVVGAVRHHLVGRARGRATTKFLEDQACLLAERQLGRARGDLRLRLSEAERLLLAQVEAQADEALDRLSAAAGIAGRLARESAPERAAELRRLQRRRDALMEAVSLLDVRAGEPPDYQERTRQ